MDLAVKDNAAKRNVLVWCLEGDLEATNNAGSAYCLGLDPKMAWL
jgi:hypothetical protein